MDKRDDYIADQRVERQLLQANPCSFERHLERVIDFAAQSAYRGIRIHCDVDNTRGPVLEEL